jgi:hypothetical protein
MLALWVGPACIYGIELEGETADEREREARSIRRRFGQAPIEDQIEDEPKPAERSVMVPRPGQHQVHRYQYVQGDLVLEFDRDGVRQTVCVPESEAPGLKDAILDDDDYAWQRVETLYQEQRRN